MPSLVDPLRVGKEFDKRRKLTDEDKENIKSDYETGFFSIRGLARKYEVDKRTIQFILFPERLEECKKRRAERGGSKIYYEKEKHQKSMEQHRAYKKDLVLDGKLKLKKEGKFKDGKGLMYDGILLIDWCKTHKEISYSRILFRVRQGMTVEEAIKLGRLKKKKNSS